MKLQAAGLSQPGEELVPAVSEASHCCMTSVVFRMSSPTNFVFPGVFT